MQTLVHSHWNKIWMLQMLAGYVWLFLEWALCFLKVIELFRGYCFIMQKKYSCSEISLHLNSILANAMPVTWIPVALCFMFRTRLDFSAYLLFSLFSSLLVIRFLCSLCWPDHLTECSPTTGSNNLCVVKSNESFSVSILFDLVPYLISLITSNRKFYFPLALM